MSGNRKNFVGKKFGKLTVIEKTKVMGANKHYLYLCKCECGNEKLLEKRNIVKGLTRSCGCLRKTNCTKQSSKVRSKFYVEGTDLLQLKNDKIAKNNKSGVTGVFKIKNGNWKATLQFKGQLVLNREFKNKQHAIAARKEAEEKYFKPILEKYNKKRLKARKQSVDE